MCIPSMYLDVGHFSLQESLRLSFELNISSVSSEVSLPLGSSYLCLELDTDLPPRYVANSTEYE